MSWWAHLISDEVDASRDWNYTHNCNGMIEAVLGEAAQQTETPFWARMGATGMGQHTWWKLLDGLSGTEGAAVLDRIITGLEADPARFRAMNPTNGWGSYDRLLEVLREMREAVPAGPSRWEVNG